MLQRIREFEEKLGLPKLSELSQVMPDEARLRLIKGIVSDLGKVKGSPEEMAVVYALVKLIFVEADITHLKVVKGITGDLVKLVQNIPKDILSKIPVEEIVEEIRKRMAEE